MTDLIFIVPSRERPEAAQALIETFRQTCTADTELVFALDDSDPTRDDYPGTTHVGPSRNMVEALNGAAKAVTSGDAPFAVGFMGDDHRPRTRGWDTEYLKTLRELGTGIVYGDDLLQGRNLPTQCAMTADIVLTLGYMSPPSLTHMYVDNFWLTLGRSADCVRYLPDVVIEHRHPVAGKAQWDEGYLRVNDPGMFAKDEAAYLEYCQSQLAEDVQKVRALRSSVTT